MTIAIDCQLFRVVAMDAGVRCIGAAVFVLISGAIVVNGCGITTHIDVGEYIYTRTYIII